MSIISIQYYKSPYGELVLGVSQDKLCLCDWRYRKMRDRIDKRITQFLQAEFVEQPHPVIDKTLQQLEEYFRVARRVFDIPLLLAGTAFQQQVWQALLAIPYGQTSSYLQLAQNLGDSNAVRAVATANGANAISIIVPCHRIIGSNGQLVGYAGGLQAKQRLLALESDLFSLQSSGSMDGE